MILTPDQQDWLRLFLVPGIGSVRFLKLLAHFQKPGRVLRASVKELSDVIGKTVAQRIRQHADAVDMEYHQYQMKTHGVSMVTMDDPAYPVSLAETYDAPVLFFIKGTLLESDQKSIAIVGTRRPSSIGLKTAHQLAYELAARGITVVSGLAEGIDTAAHKGALDAGGRTIAVLGCGLDSIYPASNKTLSEEISRQGCLLSPFVMGTRAIRGNFPRRNHIISGL
ncbi:MAG TPA: DNA-processing protein DprA, partial [Candidatus Hydrogenedentes bacterium]|nr:DNA-processing protein DprA [Candidatus Hydrogenedentota bacterium]